jgi:hypothetical protein
MVMAGEVLKLYGQRSLASAAKPRARAAEAPSGTIILQEKQQKNKNQLIPLLFV